MKLTNLIILLLSPHSICAYNPFKAPTPSMKEQIVLSLPANITDIDLTAILESPPRKSEVYAQAMISLQNLQGESFCHRLAVQLLMNNCKNIKEISDDGLPFQHDAHKNQVEGFITGLTLCVLARGEFVISDSCAPFTASALLRAHNEGKQKLDVSKDQNDACVAALSREASQWATWLSQQREALTICRAVRLDIEKDETISLHKELTRIMAEFAGGLDLDLERLKRSMAEQSRVMDSHFESALGQMKVKLQGTVEVALNSFQDVTHSLKTTLGTIVDVDQILKVLLKTIVQSNAEVAAGQEMALVASSDLAASRMNGINALAEDTSASLNDLKSAIGQLIPAVALIAKRQDATDLQAQLLYLALNNMTNLVNIQAEAIEQATFAAKDLSSQIKQASEGAKAWIDSFSACGLVVVWMARIFLSPIGVLAGVWGLPRSAILNGVLYVCVLAVFEVPNLLIYLKSWWSMPWDWEWASSKRTFETQSPSSLTQLAREKVGSLAIIPVEFELLEAV